MIPYTHPETGLRAYHAPVTGPRRRVWPWVAAALLLGTLAALGCTRRRLVVVVVPGPLTHFIGAWLDDDQVCVGEPPWTAVYVTSRCLSMAAIRTVILSAQAAP